MHDPKCVAHEIKNPFSRGEYPDPLITIWHCDPETDGTDDSCGWFMRDRHLNQDKLKKVEKEFQFEFEHNYWFDKTGKQIFSTIGTLMLMYRKALWVHFDGDRKKVDRFINKHLAEIINFAENPIDCIGDDITGKFFLSSGTNLNASYRFRRFAGIVYADICRKERPWYQHPKWHVWHWQIQFHPWQNLKRRLWDKCTVCGKRGFTGSAYGASTGICHEQCMGVNSKPIANFTR